MNNYQLVKVREIELSRNNDFNYTRTLGCFVSPANIDSSFSLVLVVKCRCYEPE